MKTFLKNHYKKISISLIILLVLFFIAGSFLKKIPKREDRGLGNRSISSKQEKDPKGCKSNPDPIFTHPFIDLSKMEALGPLGTIGGGSMGRSYMDVKDQEMVPVYSPTDANLETIIWAPRGDPSKPAEYGLYFRASCEVIYLFDHLDDLTDEIKKYAPKEPAKNTATENGSKPNVLIKAGTPLGFSNGAITGGTFDFLLMNEAKKVFRINPERWTWAQTNYASCPYEYFVEDLKSKYFALLGSINMTGLVKAKNCGSSSADILGTVSGGWFKGESTDAKGDYMGIVERPDSVDIVTRKDSQITSSIGDWDTKVTPEMVTLGKSHCYLDNNQKKWAFTKLIDDRKLSIVFGDGSCPSVFPVNKAEVWER